MGLANNDPNTLQVGIPPPPRQIMSVADPVAVDGTLVTDFTARHEGNLPYEIDKKYSTEA